MANEQEAKFRRLARAGASTCAHRALVFSCPRLACPSRVCLVCIHFRCTVRVLLRFRVQMSRTCSNMRHYYSNRTCLLICRLGAV